MDAAEYRSRAFAVYLSLVAAIKDLSVEEQVAIRDAAQTDERLWALSLLAFSWYLSEARVKVDDPIQDESRSVMAILSFLDTDSLKRAIGRAASAEDEVAIAGSKVLVKAALRDLGIPRLTALIGNGVFKKLAASLLSRHPIPTKLQPVKRAAVDRGALRSGLKSVGWSDAQIREILRGPKAS